MRSSGGKAERLSQCAESDYAQYSVVKFPVDDWLQERRYYPDGGRISCPLAENESYKNKSNPREVAAGSQGAVRVEGMGSR